MALAGVVLLGLTAAVRPVGAPEYQPTRLTIASICCEGILRRSAALSLQAARTILAIDVARPMEGLRREGFDVLHVVWDDRAAQGLFDAGFPTILAQHAHELPIGDLALDVVLLNAEGHERSEEELARVLEEAVRVLLPGAVLVVFGSHHVVDKAVRHPLLTGVETMENAFRRVMREPTLPFCTTCPKFPDFKPREAMACQAYVDPAYIPVTSPARAHSVSLSPNVSIGRLDHWDYATSVLASNPRGPSNSTWAVRYAQRDRAALLANYIQAAKKTEWRRYYEREIREGRWRRVLDAGAGSCSLDAHLRRRGLDALAMVMAFGFCAACIALRGHVALVPAD